MPRIKVLLVDDEKDFTRIVKMNLEETRLYDVFIENRGAHALKSIKSIKPDIVLLDIIMPDLDGFKVLEAVKNSPETAATSVIMLTALDTPENREKARSLYNEDYLVKPINVSGLVTKIEEVVAQRRKAGLS